MKKDSRRSQRVADVVRAELSRLILLEAHDKDLHLVTITDVEMPPDLRSARVYFSCLGADEEREKAADALRRAAGYLRREVGRRCQLRYAPELHFTYDRSLERGARIEELLHQVLTPEQTPDSVDGADEERDEEKT
jgi:ribosome-binding factor A